MDIVYVVRDGPNEELRYSLRSLRNLPHHQVHVIGGDPGFLSNEVNHIRVKQEPHSRYQNSRRNFLTACNSQDVSDDFLLFNDDFFITSPFLMEPFPYLHGSNLESAFKDYALRVSPNNYYALGILTTTEILVQYKKTLPSELFSYELHIPMRFNKGAFLEMDQELAHGREIHNWHKRTMYGNWYNVGGLYQVDVKLRTMQAKIPTPFASTDEVHFKEGSIGSQLRSLFTDPSIYERN